MFLRRRRIAVFLVGDILLLYSALALTIFSSFGAENAIGAFFEHIVPFSYLTALWILVFFIAGLYDKKTLFFRSQLPSILFNAQLANIVLAIIFFYLISVFKIAPKTNLLIFLVISLPLIFLWRMYGVTLFPAGKKQKALFIGSGKNLKELTDEISQNEDYGLEIVRSVDIGGENSSFSLSTITE